MEADSDGEQSEAAIVFLDIQGFSRADRTEPDRMWIRHVLQDIAADLLADLGLPREALAESSDTGDGLLCVLPSELARQELLIRFFPNLNRRLLEHNDAVSPQRHIRVRVVFSQGVLFRDRPGFTGTGVVGTAVNLAARLLDSTQLRDDLARAQGRACSLMVSDAYYRSTIITENPLLAPAFRRTLVRAKDGIIQAWLYRPETRHSPDRATRRSEVEQVVLDDLAPHLFVSAFDVHVYELYERTDYVPLNEQLASALLLSAGAIVHSADPYRRDEARLVLAQYQDFIDAGEILFLLGSTVNDIEEDYRGYLENKARDYAESGRGETDVRSLEGPLRDPAALESAIEMLESSPVRLKRGYAGTDAFRRAIIRDVRPAEDMVSSVLPLEKLRRVNLSLRQLLTASVVRKGRSRRLVPDQRRVSAFLDEVNRSVHRSVISRQIILTALQEHLGELLAEQRFLFEMLETRVHVLYMSATTSPHAFTEVTPARDEASPYHHGLLSRHLGILLGGHPVPEFSPGLVRDLRECPEWRSFADHHMACLAEVAARRLADREVDVGPIFQRRSRGFPLVSAVLRSYI
jgi:hypothetical protein